MSLAQIEKAEATGEIEKALIAFDRYLPALFKAHKEELAEKDKEIQAYEDDDTTHEIDFEKLDVLSYKMKNGNLWVEQIMENIEKIAAKKGTKYLLDRLEITVKAIEA